MALRITTAGLLAGFLAVLGLGGPAAADAGKDHVHHGHVVKVEAGKLTMVGDDKKEVTHPVAKDAKITIDKKAAKLEDLRPHTHVAVTLHEHGGKHEVTKIDADTTKK